MKRTGKRQDGFLLIAALALMLVVGLLVALIAEFAAGQSDSSSMRLQSARALHTAQAGLERAFFTKSALGSTGFDGGSFSVTQTGRTFKSTGTFGNAKRTVAADAAFPFVDGTRVPVMARDVVFRLANMTNAAIKLVAMTPTWVSPTAYYETLSMQVLAGTNYGKVWDFKLASNVRAASGETKVFNSGGIILFPAGGVAEFRLGRFRVNKTGGAGGNVNMDDAAFTIRLAATGETFAPTTVRTP